MFAGKNVFTSKTSEKIKRRPSQLERAVHRSYPEPKRVFSNKVANHFYGRCYWVLRSIQYKIFYKNEDLNEEEVEKLEIGVKPPSLHDLAEATNFDPKWIKYMYGRFKNECPTGKMTEAEFQTIFTCLISGEMERKTYISRCYQALADDGTLTFEKLIECLSMLNPRTAEANAAWTVKLINGGSADFFTFKEFLAFTESVFLLYDVRLIRHDLNKETAEARATVIFKELDLDNDGVVSTDDMIRLFKQRCF